MIRNLVLVSAAAFAGVALLSLPVRGHDAPAYHGRNLLDDGQPIVTAWTATREFDSLQTAGPERVQFVTGDRWEVRAEGDPATLATLRWIVEDGRLTVGRHSDWGHDLVPATIHVTAPVLRSAGAAGSGSLAVDRLAGDAVDATVAGSGSMAVDSVAARLLKANVAGSGRMSIAGRAYEARVVLAGSSRFEGGEFTTDQANVTVAGSGKAAFRSDGKVRASLVGSGEVDVTGRAQCTQSNIGSGRLRCSG